MLPRLSLSLQFALDADTTAPEHRAALPRHKVARWIRHALDAAPDTQAASPALRASAAKPRPSPLLPDAAQVTVRIVGAEESQALNRDYRHKDYATNVLTFAYGDEAGPCADLVLCAPVVAREAREQGRSLQAHYAHLIVHGSLHAQGWDHETSAAEAAAMEARETLVLARLGFDDPYA